jgi:small-conductance mechanosensitive channel
MSGEGDQKAPEHKAGHPDPRIAIVDRIEAWREIVPELRAGALRRARAETVGFAALFAGVIIVYDHRVAWLGIRVARPHHAATTTATVAQAVTVLLLVILGWAIARDFGRVLSPSLSKRVDPATAGTIGFLVRLITLVAAVIVALRFAGIDTADIAIGASFTAVVFGLAAQQTLANLIAGLVLLSARPFRVGERVRLQGGMLAGQIEGTVTALGLLYTTFATGQDRILVPNNTIIQIAIMPLREPTAVTLRARLRPGTTPVELQQLLADGISVALRGQPTITLEELDGPAVVVKISATPVDPSEGGRLASELLEAASQRVDERVS